MAISNAAKTQGTHALWSRRYGSFAGKSTTISVVSYPNDLSIDRQGPAGSGISRVGPASSGIRKRTST